MARKRRRLQYAAGIIERFDNHILIVLPKGQGETGREWQFPRGAVGDAEAPEVAMRRLALELLGVHVEIVVGQPPLLGPIDGTESELRYFFCGMVGGEAASNAYDEIRWVSRGHLREYEFDDASQPVADWLLGEAR